ncbi:isocitrate/isopropylmalate dehydrogenase family protein [Streptomyces botrytidirepellens]|uniref:Isocitrate/isopropylmalate dehydrogenase family protein n=1 Tax=Streptomyces botrytidirepellens TaxID=2486417 RepID=A0A3M8W8T2_9ACTN|nr:isocitrate/isopropylmalate dehydrogenase family protein [Streptomyces botrytidirepellens]RNG25029.1 isocitrate/isopropylmalate dehydrogenase family protein [Streptomyces botrytidirepellens]
MTRDTEVVRLAVIPGDGIGPEVVAATVPALRAALEADGLRLDVTSFDWGGERFLRQGAAMPPDAADLVKKTDAVLFGAVGRPDVPEHELVWGLIIGLRQQLDLAVNLRPVRAFPGVPTKVRDTDGVDLVIVRENTEGEYVGAGGVAHAGSGHDLGIEVAVHSRRVIERAAHQAFALAGRRSGRLCLVTKSNAMRYGYPLWDRVVREVGEQYPQVQLETVLVDAMAARMIQAPRSLDVLLTSNLFGDILSDLAAVLAGGMGMAPSANVLPDAEVPGIYEPVHGSAPDIAGKGVANPVACLLSGAMLLDDLGHTGAARRVRDAVADTVRDTRHHTADLGGNATTADVASAVLHAIENQG